MCQLWGIACDVRNASPVVAAGGAAALWNCAAQRWVCSLLVVVCLLHQIEDADGQSSIGQRESLGGGGGLVGRLTQKQRRPEQSRAEREHTAAQRSAEEGRPWEHRGGSRSVTDHGVERWRGEQREENEGSASRTNESLGVEKAGGRVGAAGLSTQRREGAEQSNHTSIRTDSYAITYPRPLGHHCSLCFAHPRLCWLCVTDARGSALSLWQRCQKPPPPLLQPSTARL